MNLDSLRKALLFKQSPVSTKTVIAMKLSVILILVACLQVSAKGFSQTFNFRMKEASLDKVFKEIRKQGKFDYLFTGDVKSRVGGITIDVRDDNIQAVLEKVFKAYPFVTYSISNNVITVGLKPEAANMPEAIQPPIDVTGKVVNENGEPVRATVTVKGTRNAVSTNADGSFIIKDVPEDGTLVITGVNIFEREIKVNGKANLESIQAQTKEKIEPEVIMTGYKTMKPNEMIGSAVTMNRTQIERTFSTDILSRIQNLAGVLFKNGINGFQQPDNVVIRGINTIFSRQDPLIVIDNFPVEGDVADISAIVSSINPNDVENITVLKDAAATSIYGVKAANGVIVITTKRGRPNQRAKVSLTTNFNFQEKPDLYDAPILSVSDYIDVEAYLFRKSYYDASIIGSYAALTPAVEVFLRRRNGIISSADSAMQINSLKSLDARDDLLKYNFKVASQQQYAVNVSGGGTDNQYYLSLGYDHNANGTGISKRYSFNAANTYGFFNRKLEFTGAINYSQTSFDAIPNLAGDILYPYAQLADDSGNPLIIAKRRQSFIDTVGGGNLLDWNYYPLNERKYADNKTTASNLRTDAGLRYRIIPGLDLDLKYQYTRHQSDVRSLNNLQTYFARDLINLYTDLTKVSPTLRNPIPIGGILDQGISTYRTHNGRAQLNFQRSFSQFHKLSVFVGSEVRDVAVYRQRYRLYGYNEDNGTTVPVDFVNNYPTFFGGSSRIPNTQGIGVFSNRAASFYSSLSYVFRDRYSFMASARKDGANVFGATSNNKWKPLWSAGVAWDLDQEEFFKIDWLNLRLKANYGYQGNIPPIPALLTINYSNINEWRMQTANVNNIPNPDLRWEKIGQLNLGLEFSLIRQRFSGSIEYYRKKGTDIIGREILAPSIGYPSAIMKNSADMKARGWDITLNSYNIQKRNFSWLTSFTFSYSRDWITDYKLPPNNVGTYVEGLSMNPIVGRPVNSLYSYKWAGLDPDTGDPQGFLDGQVSKNYTAMYGSVNLEEMVYNGPAIAPFFGGLMNTFRWKDFSFSFFIKYKYGYYFRRTSINYNGLFQGSNLGHTDYLSRWQIKGDELTTNVPSMVYIDHPDFNNRNRFYTQSEVLVEKGDHIRLQDVRLSYDIAKQKIKKLPVQNIRIYIYASNLGLIWKANKKDIDPDYYVLNSFSSNFPLKAIAFGLKIDF